MRTTARRSPPGATVAAGGFYLCMGGVHLGLVSADTEVYRHFADGGLFGFVRDGWAEVFMAHPAVWGLLLAGAEVTLGVVMLVGGRPARVGWVAMVVFQVLLMLFGWGFWLWSLPAGAVLVAGARRDWAALGGRPSSTSGPGTPRRPSIGPTEERLSQADDLRLR